MTTKNLPKIFFTAAIVSFVIGSSGLGDDWMLYVGRPVGAILFVLFMIFQFLQKEVALYDEEQQAKLASLKRLSRTSEQRPSPTSAAPHKLVAHSAA